MQRSRFRYQRAAAERPCSAAAFEADSRMWESRACACSWPIEGLQSPVPLARVGLAASTVGFRRELEQQALVAFDHPALGKASLDDAARMGADVLAILAIGEPRQVPDERRRVVGAKKVSVVTGMDHFAGAADIRMHD